MLLKMKDEEKREKIGRVFERYGQQMYQQAFHILNSREDAEDAVADTLVALMRNADKIGEAEESAAARYVMVAVKHTAISLLRKKKKLRCTPQEEAEQLPDRKFSEQMERLAEKLDLKEYLRRLDEHYRVVLLLYFAYGLRCPEIAQRLNIPQETVKKQLYRGKKKLIKMMEESDLTGKEGSR